MKSRLILAAGLCIASLTLGAQTNFITVGKHQAHPTRILARYFDAVSAATGSATVDALGLKTARQSATVPGLVVLDEAVAASGAASALAFIGPTIPPGQKLLDRIAALQDSGLFAYVEPDYIVSASLEPNDAAFQDGRLWGLRNTGQAGGVAGADINAVRAWDLSTGSTNVIVAVIDTGIRYTHQDLAAQMWHNPLETPGNGIDDDGNGFVDDVYGINAINNSGNPFDDNDHGTHCAGTIGAAANDGNPHVGVSWKVQLMACKFLGAEGFGALSDAITCIDYASVNGAKILNNSWGGGGFSQALRDSIAAAGGRGALFVAAAGNSGQNTDLNPAYPASYDLDNIVSVAALDRSDRLASFSNYGLTSVDVGAPGVEIFSSTAASDSSYASFQGTSMACPHVAGVAALVLAYHPGAPLTELKERLLSTATPVAALAGRSVTGGRVNAYLSMIATNDGILEVSVNPPSGTVFCEGTPVSIFVQVSDLFRVTNATVRGTIAGYTNVTFANNGVNPDAQADDSVYSARLVLPLGATNITMDLTITAPGKTDAATSVDYLVQLLPVNDRFATATKLPAAGALVTADSKCATEEAGEPLHARIPTRSKSLWWNWSPSSTGSVIVDTAGSTFDTVTAVYTGTGFSNLVEVASVDDVTGPFGTRFQGYVKFVAQAGQTYRIAVAGYNVTQFGTVRLRVEPGGEPDTTAPEVTVTSPQSGTVVTTNTAVVSGIAFDPIPNALGVEEVFILDENDNTFRSVNGTTNWTATVSLKEGVNTIRVVALDFGGNQSLTRSMQVDYRNLEPGNDVFVNAFALAGAAGTATANTGRATREVGEPHHAGNIGGRSVWWYFDAPADGVLQLTTAGSTFDTLLAVYSGTNVSNLTPIGSNDDASDSLFTSVLNQAVRSGNTYRVAVDGYGGVSGTVSLGHQFTPSAVVLVTVATTSGGQVSPGTGYYASGGVVDFTATPDSGWEFSGWSGAVVSTNNPLAFTPSGDATLTGNFRRLEITEDFELGTFNPANKFVLNSPLSSAPWRVQDSDAFGGQYAAQSGAISQNQRSSLLLQASTPAGVGTFMYRTSSELGWDFLEFYVNGALDQRWSGETTWVEYRFVVPAGTNTFEWRYVKDFSISDDVDAAFIDNISLPTEAQTLTLLTSSVKGSKLQLRGTPNATYRIEVSSDLVHWQTLSTNSSASGLIQVLDSDSANWPVRFYRAVFP